MPIHTPKIGVFGRFDHVNGEQHQCNPQKAHPCVEACHIMYRSLKSVHWCNLCARLRNQEKKTKNLNTGKLDIRPDHPPRRIKMWFCTVGDLWVVVLSFKFDQNRLSGYWDFRGQNLDSCITLANGLHNPVICTSLHTCNYASISPLKFYRPQTLSDAKLYQSADGKQLKQNKRYHFTNNNIRMA